MVIRFYFPPGQDQLLRDAVEDAYTAIIPGDIPNEEFVECGVTINMQVLRENFYLQEDLTLYINDELPADVIGLMRKKMLAHGFPGLYEQEFLVPRTKVVISEEERERIRKYREEARKRDREYIESGQAAEDAKEMPPNVIDMSDYLYGPL